MRTLLAESTPPQFIDEERLSQSEEGFAETGNNGRECFESATSGAISAEDTPADSLEQVLRIFPEAAVLASLHDLVEVGVDGIVIATPSALNAGGTVQTLERGKAVIDGESLRKGSVSA